MRCRGRHLPEAISMSRPGRLGCVPRSARCIVQKLLGIVFGTRVQFLHPIFLPCCKHELGSSLLVH